MFSLNSSNTFYLYTEGTDMRKSFDSLSGLIISQMKRDPLSGEVFVFINKNRNKIKLLHWEAYGFTLYYKRLESGTLELPDMDKKKGSLSLKWTDLVLIIEGISLKNIQQRKRYKQQL